jgi:hypothetical protein
VNVRRTLLLGLLLLVGACRHSSTTKPAGPDYRPSPFLQALDDEDFGLAMEKPVDKDERNAKWHPHVTLKSDLKQEDDREILLRKYEGVFHYEDDAGKRLDCRPEDRRRILAALKDALNRRLRTGVEEIEPGALDIDDGTANGFELHYKAGNTSGKITARAAAEGTGPDAVTRLTVELREEVRPR